MTMRVAAATLTFCLLLFPAVQGVATGQEIGTEPKSRTEDQMPSPAGGRLLASAWEQYRLENYEKAVEFFRLALQAENPDQQNEARLGLGYALQRLGRTAEAETAFQSLWDKGYDRTRTGPALVGIYLKEGRLDEAEELVARLPLSVREEWFRQVEQARAGQKRQASGQTMKQAWEALAQKKYRLAAELFRAAGEQLPVERRQEVRMGMAYAAWGQGRLSEARGIFEDLIREGYKTEQIKPDLVKLLLNQNEIERARLLMRELPPEKRSMLAIDLAEALKRRRGIRLETLFQSMSRTEDPTVKRKLALEILKIEPGNRAALGVLGWSCRELKKYDCALETFQTLYVKEPTPDNLLGLAYTLVDLNRGDEAMTLIERHPGALPPEARELKARLYRESAGALYEREEFEAAEKLLRRVLELKPEDPETLELLGWTLYKQGRTDEALEIFRVLFDQEPSARKAEALLAALDRKGRDLEARDFVDRLAEEKTRPDLLALAADRYAAAGWYISAAQTLSDPQKCFYNCDKPWLEIAPHYSFREGDAGTSRFSQYALPIFLHQPLSGGRSLSFGVAVRYLDAGRAEGKPYAGSYYRVIDNPTMRVENMITERTVWQPHLAYEREGPIWHRLALGTTPLGGPVTPLPTFDFQASATGDWQVRLSQCAVGDSLLSLIGQNDPYSDRDWGRVVRTALNAEKIFDLGDSYWLTLSGEYGYLWGKNTKDNHVLSGTVSIGQNRTLWQSQQAYGLFATVEHFENNQDFYTYGHGGYFSPEFFFMAGPFFNWKSPPCQEYLLNLDASLGYMHYYTSEAPVYRQKGDLALPATVSSLRDYHGVYQGEEKDGIGLHVQVEWGKLLTPFVAFGGQAGIDTSSSHTAWQAGLWWRIYFEPHRAICPDSSVGRSCP
jgi:tetratricopeptide (TPR) repeat protein